MLFLGKIVLTTYNNKTYRVDDVSWDVSPQATFKMRDEQICYMDYYQKVSLARKVQSWWKCKWMEIAKDVLLQYEWSIPEPTDSGIFGVSSRYVDINMARFLKSQQYTNFFDLTNRQSGISRNCT